MESVGSFCWLTQLYDSSDVSSKTERCQSFHNPASFQPTVPKLAAPVNKCEIHRWRCRNTSDTSSLIQKQLSVNKWTVPDGEEPEPLIRENDQTVYFLRAHSCLLILVICAESQKWNQTCTKLFGLLNISFGPFNRGFRSRDDYITTERLRELNLMNNTTDCIQMSFDFWCFATFPISRSRFNLFYSVA